MNRRKSVAFYTENYAYGGLERFLFDALQAVPADWDAILLHNDYPGFTERLAARVTRPVTRIPVPIRSKPLFVENASKRLPRLAVRAAAKLAAKSLARRHFAHNLRVIRDALQKTGLPDVLHVVNGGYPGAESSAAAARAGAELGIPRRLYSVLSVHQPGRAPDAAVEKRLQEDATCFVANCEAGREALIRHRGFPPASVVAVHTGISPLQSDPIKARALRTKWLGDGTVLLGCLGALYPLKGHRFMIEAMPAVLEKHPGARLVLIGDGESAGALKAQARALGIERAVAFPGYVDGDAADALAALDLFVHPTSQIEGLPYAILEAMALGKPVIATEVGGVPEAVQDGLTGLLVPPASASALAEAVNAVLGDPALARRLADAGQRRQRTDFTSAAAAAGLLALYEDSPRVGAPS